MQTNDRDFLHEEYEHLRRSLPVGVWSSAIADEVYRPRGQMYRHSGGRNFQQLCDLIGQTAKVGLTEAEYYDGFREHCYSWTERLTITEFRGATDEPIYNDEGDQIGYEMHPYFTAVDRHGRTYTVFADHLMDVRPAD